MLDDGGKFNIEACCKIFIVTPYINNNKYFFAQLMKSIILIVGLLKHITIISAASTCLGSRMYHCACRYAHRAYRQNSGTIPVILARH